MAATPESISILVGAQCAVEEMRERAALKVLEHDFSGRHYVAEQVRKLPIAEHCGIEYERERIARIICTAVQDGLTEGVDMQALVDSRWRAFLPEADAILMIVAPNALEQLSVSSHEAFEAALTDLVAWAEAYPKTVFLPPDYAKAHEALQSVGITLDAVSADIMRTAMDEVGKRARSALKPKAQELPTRNEEAEELFQSERISEALATYDYILGDLEPGDPDWEESAFNAMKAAIQRADHIARSGQIGER